MSKKGKREEIMKNNLDIVEKHQDFDILKRFLTSKQLEEINEEIADYYFDENDEIKSTISPMIFTTSVAWYKNLMDTETFIERVKEYEKIKVYQNSKYSFS